MQIISYLRYLRWRFLTRKQRVKFPNLFIYSPIETAQLIKEKKLSISRFGDGEFGLMFSNTAIGFQSKNENLKSRLIEVFQSDIKNHLIGLPDAFHSFKNFKLSTKVFWTNFINNNANFIAQYSSSDLKYGNTNLTRFYMDYENVHFSKTMIHELKNIWNNENLLIVEGKQTKLGTGNNLFDNAKSIKRLICPSTNAFDKYDTILEKAMEYGKNQLILIALGPTATVLSHDLAKNKYWAIDIGHVDIEYSWFLMKAKTKVAIQGKYVNEAKQKIVETDTINQDYLNSICYTIL